MKTQAAHFPLVSLRMVKESAVPYDGAVRISSALDAVAFIRPMADGMDREAVWVLCLSAKLGPTCLSLVSLGTLDSAPVHPREVFKPAVLSNAHRVILIHNHPSGDPKPSRQDDDITARIKQAGELLGIALIDHLVIASNGEFYSYQHEGRL